ncbi:MAG: DUF1080 domain-containing protein [Planctomycetia bacterium]|nr:DUF1080 domain-containing protein [Planctomycetia bacterium]
MKLPFFRWLLVVGLAICPAAVQAADNELTAQEKADGYVLLFNGSDLDGFRPCSTLHYSKWIVEDGAIRTCLFGGRAKYVPPGHLYTAKDYGNYVLKVDVRLPPAPKETHSGIILRVGGTPPDAEAAGLEVDIYGAGRRLGLSCTGSFRHELRAPSKSAVKTDGDWNSFVITVNGNRIDVELNGEKINQLDLDEWTTAGKRPDGTVQRLTKLALKDMPRTGRIGFRDDHGSPIWYRNIKLKPLP